MEINAYFIYNIQKILGIRMSTSIKSLISKISDSLFSLSNKVRYLSSTATAEKINNIFIVGGGCIGQCLAASLLRSNSNNRVFLVTKEKYAQEISKSGIITRGVVDNTFLPSDKFRVIHKIDCHFFEENQIDIPIIFSATKASDTVASLEPFFKLKRIKPTIICLQNGVGTEREVKEALPIEKGTVLKGHVLGAVHKIGSGLFAYRGKILVEQPTEKRTYEELMQMFILKDKGIFDLEISGDIYKDIYPKIAVNCVCNPLTIILNQNLGFIRSYYEPLIRAICQEIYNVAKASHIELRSCEHLTQFVLDMMSRYSEHYSSMYLDHQYGKETEINYINGGVLRIADEHGIKVPINKLLTKSILEIQEMRSRVSSSEEFYKIHQNHLDDLSALLMKLVVSENYNF